MRIIVIINKFTSKLCLILFLSIVQLNIAQQNNDYNILNAKSDTLQNSYLLNRLKIQFDKRRKEFEKSLKSKEAFFERQNRMQNWFYDIVGDLHEKNYLNTITTRKEEYDKFTIEWVAFESRPNHHVTCLLYLPKNAKIPCPAVFIPSGHSVLGKGSEAYQRAARLFAMNGFAVLQSDPICQGERMQYLDENGKPVTEERMLMHEILGQHLMLTGSNTLIHELHDNIRCIDFLEQHPAIDKNKIAVAGNSGGGTQALYLTAYDKRIKTSVVSCYLSTTESKFNTIGSQDGCQQLWGEAKVGIEEQDFLLMAAPIPIAVLSTTEDFFDRNGAKNAVDELRKAYSLLGESEKIRHVFAQGKHGWQKPLREAAVQWCKKWFMDDDSPVTEPDDIGFLVNNDFCVTTTGQVLTKFRDELSVSDIVREKLVACKENRKLFLSSSSNNIVIDKVKDLIGFDGMPTKVKSTFIQSYNECDYKIEKYLLERDSNSLFRLPAILFIPKLYKSDSVTIYVSESGKTDNDKINKLVKDELKKGNTVLALDVSNTGELQYMKTPRYDNKEFWIAKMALYEGKTLLAYRAEDILTAKKFLEEKIKNNKIRFSIASKGLTGPAAIHAAAIDGSFDRVMISDSIKSWEDVASENYSSNQLGNIVPGVLNYYDLPDLIKLIPKTKIILSDKN